MQGGVTVRGGTVNSVNRQHSLISTLIGSFAFITRSTSLTNSYNSSVSSFSFIVIRRKPRARSSLPVRVLCATVHSSSLVEQHSFFKLSKFRPALVWDPLFMSPNSNPVGSPQRCWAANVARAPRHLMGPSMWFLSKQDSWNLCSRKVEIMTQTLRPSTNCLQFECDAVYFSGLYFSYVQNLIFNIVY